MIIIRSNIFNESVTDQTSSSFQRHRNKQTKKLSKLYKYTTLWFLRLDRRDTLPLIYDDSKCLDIFLEVIFEFRQEPPSLQTARVPSILKREY